jgi:hypothetical protein
MSNRSIRNAVVGSVLLRTIAVIGGATLAFPIGAWAQDAAPDSLPPGIDKSSALRQDNRLAYRNNPLTVTNAQGQMAHVLPTVQRAAAMSPIQQLGIGPLAYGGGPIMPSIEIYAIYWVGALQSGGSASLTSHYESVESGLTADYAGHTLSSNNTQYYQTSPTTQYITGLSAKARLELWRPIH